MRRSCAILSSAFVLSACGNASGSADADHDFAAKVRVSDIAVLVGDDWEGTLTYLNYGEPKKDVTIPAKLAVAQNHDMFELYFEFPEEPDANGRAELVISDDGRMLNDETVTRRMEEDGTLTLVTESDCKDAAVQAKCEFTYDISPSALSIRKMVTLDGDTDAYRRNHYSFTR